MKASGSGEGDIRATPPLGTGGTLSHTAAKKNTHVCCRDEGEDEGAGNFGLNAANIAMCTLYSQT